MCNNWCFGLKFTSNLIDMLLTEIILVKMWRFSTILVQAQLLISIFFWSPHIEIIASVTLSNLYIYTDGYPQNTQYWGVQIYHVHMWWLIESPTRHIVKKCKPLMTCKYTSSRRYIKCNNFSFKFMRLVFMILQRYCSSRQEA